MKRLLLCLTALLALSGCADATARQEPLASGGQSDAGQSSAPETSAMPGAGTPGTAAPTTASPAVPRRLRLGTIDVPIVPITLDGSALTPPDDPRTLGWWGKRAGSRHGTTLLTGHTVHDGGGAFDDLEHTPLGQRARLSGHSYRVMSVEVISKSELTERAPTLFAQTGRPKLVLVTCEDYDPATGHYASNVVVVLEQAR
jgi:sortase family protein